MIWALGACAAAQQALAQAGLPTIQAVEGTISPSKAAIPVTPASSDELVLVNVNTGKRESAAFSIDREGAYLMVITKDASFNGTPLTLRLRKGSITYNLLDAEEGDPVEFQYAGTLLGSARITLNMRIGPKAAGAPVAKPGGDGGPVKPVNTNPEAVDCIAPRFDVNGDGKCDEADIEQIQNFLLSSSRSPRGTVSEARPEDVNGDGAVNVRDLLEAARALQQARIAELRRRAAAQRTTIERPEASERPASGMAKEIDAARSGARDRPAQSQ